ncbi:MAG TPA: PEP-CTERM sorting domain-containing protein, partial [Candidatus Angelobacter sp.]|nr:PEP-CTERM sorting domain-containing protein [Candidatus Angelobacter sp.]
FITLSGSTAPWATNPLWNLKTISLKLTSTKTWKALSTFSKKDHTPPGPLTGLQSFSLSLVVPEPGSLWLLLFGLPLLFVRL